MMHSVDIRGIFNQDVPESQYGGVGSVLRDSDAEHTMFSLSLNSKGGLLTDQPREEDSKVGSGSN